MPPSPEVINSKESQLFQVGISISVVFSVHVKHTHNKKNLFNILTSVVCKTIEVALHRTVAAYM